MQIPRRTTRTIGVRRLIRQAIERLPVGRRLAIRLGRAIVVRLGAPPVDGRVLHQWERVPRRFVVSPAPRPISLAGPEPPLADGATAATRSLYPTGPPDSSFDIELFEALNAEYASKPLVPEPRGNDPASYALRARDRLVRVHASIDLADRQVLEFGCGTGSEVWTLSHQFGSDATGIDVVERAAWQALADERTHYVLADIAVDRPFPADHFDRIVSFSVLEHVVHPRSTLEELHRVLRPGGLAWISANLYRGPMASHLYRDVYFPWPHLLFSDDVFREFYRRRGLPAAPAVWVNRLSWTEYEAIFRRTGYRLRSLTFSERTFDEALYQRFSSVLSRYPRWDLSRDFFHVVLEKPRRRPSLFRGG
jgi:SAM-dependent methyltransferase